MAEHREQVDKRMMKQINRRVLTPLLIDLGARYLVKPYMGKYDDEEKTAKWGFGHKKHGDKRHRTTVTYLGINYHRRGDEATARLTSAWRTVTRHGR